MRCPITFFVSYARKDKRLADRLVAYLSEQLAPSRCYVYTLWRDTAVLVGQRWHAEIQQALTDCQAGLLLLSPAFLGSAYITQHELPRFLQLAKPILPVLCKPIDPHYHDLKGLDPYQMFRLDDHKAFADCTTDVVRSRFAATLFAQIEQRLDRLGYHP
jgi:hypothetical protein